VTGEFLPQREPVTWAAPAGFPRSLEPDGLFVQDAPHGLEVVLARATRKPTVADLRSAWTKRRAGRVTPVLLVVVHPVHGERRVALCGPVGEQPAIHHNIEVSQAERLAAVALDEPNRHAATRFLLAALPELDSDLPGLRNVGLLATQELRDGVPDMPAWQPAVQRAGPLLGLRGRPLVERLGFGVEVLSTNTSLLTVNGRNRAIAVFCDEDEPFDAPAKRFDGTSPVSRGLAVADQHNVDWVVLTRAAEIRLYAARPDTGVGRKGRAETFVELNLSLLPADKAGYLHLLFSTDALAAGGTTEQILERSADFASDLAVRLRRRVYFDTVPALAKALAARLDHRPGEGELDDAYEQVMMILFRLLFVAYAEDKDLLPYRTNSRYADHSLKRMARRLTEDRRSGRTGYDDKATDMWDDVRQLWRAVDAGNSGWGVPAYDGGLFSHDRAVSPSGAALAALRLTDAEFAPALAALLVDEGEEGPGPVDFRSLSVREFGTIYEGLLESRLAVAADDLTVRRIKGNDQYVPATGDDPVEVVAGGVYLHNRSGVRMATGSYFTKPFAVEHLLDHALEPALEDHVARLDALHAAGDDAALAGAFFDFRCADIAMGSGHFLVAALDRIEARLSAWLPLRPPPCAARSAFSNPCTSPPPSPRCSCGTHPASTACSATHRGRRSSPTGRSGGVSTCRGCAPCRCRSGAPGSTDSRRPGPIWRRRSRPTASAPTTPSATQRCSITTAAGMTAHDHRRPTRRSSCRSQQQSPRGRWYATQARSKSALSRRRSRRITAIVPTLRSLLPQFGIVVRPAVAGLRQISWEPRACRSNSHPSARSLRLNSR
jgi:hypothetical protein